MMQFQRAARCAAIVSLILCPFALVAQSTESTNPNQKASANSSAWTVDDLLLSQDARSFRISPDGQSVVWVRTAMDKTKDRTTSNLYVTPTRGGASVQLTEGDHTVSSPHWSPDGTRIAFLASLPLPGDSAANVHAASTQIWSVDPRGGRPSLVTRVEGDMDDFAWKTPSVIVYLAEEEPSAYGRLMRDRKDDSRVVDDSLHEPPNRLFSVDLDSHITRRLTENTDWIQDFALSPDGNTVVTVHQRSLSEGYDQKIPSITRLTNLETGSSRIIYDGKRTIPYNFAWASDGAGFYFVNDTTTSPRYRTATIALLDYYDLASGTTFPVDRTWSRAVAGNMRPTPDGVMANLANGVFVKPARFVKHSSAGQLTWTRVDISGVHVANSFDFDVSADAHAFVYRYTRANVPPQLFGAMLNQSQVTQDVQITQLNPSLVGKPQPAVEVVHWKGARDETVEGLLTYPLQYTAGKRYPLILTIHGGPALADLDEWKQIWSYPKLLLNQKGAFTLQINYHGSSRYGLQWVESICCGNIYDLETPDLERGIDYVVSRGLADTAKLGSLGHSYGAILTTQLTTIDPRLKAASAASGDVEWFSDWGVVSFGASYDNYYFGSSPWDDPELYVRKSPVFRFDKVRTPTIIYQGTNDRQVPPGQGWTYFRTLQQIGKAPVRFVNFPGAAHSPSKYVHQRRKVDEDMAWFDRYLFDTTDSADDWLNLP
ncbi:MAG: prolyl oligopeptidase family serine peptidase [Gemmatimonadaceae bacterium]